MVAFASRKPNLRLTLPIDQETGVAANLQGRIERKVASDAKYLPKSTNMGLPAHFNTGEKYNFEEDASSSPLPSLLPPKKLSTFKRAIPCLNVDHISTALPWYKEVLGFIVVGKADEGRAELHRAHPGSRKGEGGVNIYLRRGPSDKGLLTPATLYIEVDDVDALFAEVQYKVTKYAQDLTNYFPHHHFGSSKVIAKPRNSAHGERREMSCVDANGNIIIFFSLLD